MPEPITNQNGHARKNGEANTNSQLHKPASRKANREDVAVLIQQAEALRTLLRDTLLKTNGLVKALKRHRRQSRIVSNTLASLRQLKSLGV